MDQITAMNILGLRRGQTQEDLKKTFHQLAHKHHPDKGGDVEHFKKLSAAYTYLQKSGIPALEQPDQFVNPRSRTWDPETDEAFEEPPVTSRGREYSTNTGSGRSMFGNMDENGFFEYNAATHKMAAMKWAQQQARMRHTNADILRKMEEDLLKQQEDLNLRFEEYMRRRRETGM